LEFQARVGDTAAVSTDVREVVRRKFLQLGLDEDEAEACTEAELEGAEPVLAGETLLFLCWEGINGWKDPGALSSVPAAVRLGRAGADVEDLGQLARAVAFHAVFDLLYLLSEGSNFRLRDVLKVWDPGYPGWSLQELDPEGRPTGRTVSSLYEGLRTSDPSGLEARDFLE
jgi:hypothetical protein